MATIANGVNMWPAVAGAATQTSGSFNVANATTYCVQVIVTATLQATVSLEFSNNLGVTWTSITLATQALDGAGTASVGFNSVRTGYGLIRVKSVTTGGAGTVEAWITAKNDQ